jgi:hypothetical protein
VNGGTGFRDMSSADCPERVAGGAWPRGSWGASEASICLVMVLLAYPWCIRFCLVSWRRFEVGWLLELEHVGGEVVGQPGIPCSEGLGLGRLGTPYVP